MSTRDNPLVGALHLIDSHKTWPSTVDSDMIGQLNAVTTVWMRKASALAADAARWLTPEHAHDQRWPADCGATEETILLGWLTQGAAVARDLFAHTDIGHGSPAGSALYQALTAGYAWHVGEAVIEGGLSRGAGTSTLTELANALRQSAAWSHHISSEQAPTFDRVCAALAGSDWLGHRPVKNVAEDAAATLLAATYTRIRPNGDGEDELVVTGCPGLDTAADAALTFNDVPIPWPHLVKIMTHGPTFQW